MLGNGYRWAGIFDGVDAGMYESTSIQLWRTCIVRLAKWETDTSVSADSVPMLDIW